MKKIMNKTLAVLLITLTSQSHSFAIGDGSTGGGNALVCFDNTEIPKELKEKTGNSHGKIQNRHLEHITHVEILDLYFARQLKGVERTQRDLDLIHEGETYLDYENRLLDKISLMSLDDGYYLKRQQKLFNENLIPFTEGLDPVEDVNSIGGIDEENCVIATIARQENSIIGQKKLSIDDRLFLHPKHSDLSKAITNLHEYLYSYYLSKGNSSDARPVREMVAVILDKSTTILTFQRFMRAFLYSDSDINSFFVISRTGFHKSIEDIIKYYENQVLSYEQMEAYGFKKYSLATYLQYKKDVDSLKEKLDRLVFQKNKKARIKFPNEVILYNRDLFIPVLSVLNDPYNLFISINWNDWFRKYILENKELAQKDKEELQNLLFSLRSSGKIIKEIYDEISNHNNKILKRLKQDQLESVEEVVLSLIPKNLLPYKDLVLSIALEYLKSSRFDVSYPKYPLVESNMQYPRIKFVGQESLVRSNLKKLLMDININI